MRRITVAAFLAVVVVLTLLASNKAALAEDYITDAARALQHGRVYVAPGTEGTDNDTSGKLQARLNSNDNIVLVMLPSAAESEIGADIATIASRLSQKLGNRRIIGLAVGKKVVGYAPTLPAGVAADQMRRAESVSNDPITALGTFVQNVHIWQREHPQPKPSPPKSPEKGGLSWFVWLLLSLGIAITVVTLVIGAIRHGAAQANTDPTHFRVPRKVKGLLVKIARESEQVIDPELSAALYPKMCRDIERYFRSSSKNKKADSLIFRDRLTEVVEILDKYIDAQDSGRYYNKRDAFLRQGKEALLAFGQYVLDSIRRGNDADLVEFQFNAETLQAYRLLADPTADFERRLKATNHEE